MRHGLPKHRGKRHEQDTQRRNTLPRQLRKYFSDLGRPDAEEALARVRLAQQIAQIIERKALSQTAAAELMGIDQPKGFRLGAWSAIRLFD